MIKVLIADDENIVRRTIRLIGNWEENGMEIAGEAGNGVEAVEMIREIKPDLILLDMKMPGYTGEEVLNIIEKEYPACSVIVISGYDDFRYAKVALKYGAVDYILKPIDRNELNAALKKVYVRYGSRGNTDGVLRIKDISEQIRERIDTGYAEDISVGSLAGEYYVNKDVLSRSFKKKYGMGISAYINHIRLEQAKVYLLAGYSITKAAELVGYHDVNYFSRIFKKIYGVSPSRYLESYSDLEK